ncbi:PilZ domain-containing protein [Altererythrobacter arenosus]|uniref:PilZ domain-containing protein n=1 Tax=Altererythrobacter arenosus TaxID=3032592 RepID=A0ABY8G1Y5_9SPHN|nr:PilZ domain-containing protein [Altererythrobacter sp. CAU 1644]WFL78934.1 PilZ domain-containing protein [Altererythrobacter sp. CAU 1644]
MMTTPGSQGRKLPQVECRYRNGRKMVLDILDISLGGCMVDARGWGADVWERVSVKLPGLGWQGASVVWIEDQRAGIALEEPLHEATLAHIMGQSLLAA